MNSFDYIIVGGGIVGLATALNLIKHDPKSKLLVLEKESRLGVHQTGNNSGVIHSGIYYKPGSAKALNCRKGYNLLLDYCNKNNVDYKICGKLIVATCEMEEPRLLEIYNRGLKNGLENLKILSVDLIKEYEPNVNGTKAILVPQTGIIDYSAVLESFENKLRNKEVVVELNAEVINIHEKTDSVEVVTKKNVFLGKKVITCSGLLSDKLARMTERYLDFRIIPFRGEYYKLKNSKSNLVKGLIYPVPDPSFPFLGVHFTSKINGEIEAGPNAVLSFAKEGYKKLDFNLRDTINTFTWPGFQKVALQYWRTGLGEFYRSFNKSAFTKALQKLVPNVNEDDLIKAGSGIRAQACDKYGNLVDDFKFVQSKRVLHVCNAPSPAATASLAIGEKISEIVLN